MAEQQTSLLDLPDVDWLRARRLVPRPPAPPAEVREAAEKGIKAAAAKVGTAWMAMALGRLEVVARDREFFTADEVWERISAPADPRAMGAVMRAAKRLRWIEGTGRYRTSGDKVCHGRKKEIWRSLIFKG